MIKIKKSLLIGNKDAQELNYMFNSLIDETKMERSIALNKCKVLRLNIKRYHKILSIWSNFNDLKDFNAHMGESIKQIEDFSVKIKNEYTFIDFSEDEKEIKHLDNLSTNDLIKLYSSITKSPTMTSIIVTTKNLRSFEHQLTGELKIGETDRFITIEPGINLILLDFSNLDLKKIWNDDKITLKFKEFILRTMIKLYELGMEIYKIITSPNIDIKRFSKILVKNIGKLKRQIPNCDTAFNAILSSVKLLENNFGDYYRDSVHANNPNIIIENFIMDVSQNQKPTAILTLQFKKIIGFIQRHSKKNDDPKVSQLYDLLQKNMDLMEKNVGCAKDEDIKDDKNVDHSDDNDDEKDDELDFEMYDDEQENVNNDEINNNNDDNDDQKNVNNDEVNNNNKQENNDDGIKNIVDGILRYQ